MARVARGGEGTPRVLHPLGHPAVVGVDGTGEPSLTVEGGEREGDVDAVGSTHQSAHRLGFPREYIAVHGGVFALSLDQLESETAEAKFGLDGEQEVSG